MKNIEQTGDDDSLLPEYRHSDFDEMVRGKYAYAELQFADIARALVVCVGEDEHLRFTQHSGNDRTGHRTGDWTYEIDKSNQITLRYWLNEFASVEESISNSNCVNTPQDRAALQDLLTKHVRTLKAKVAAR